tara:strand:- start:976 stop:1476 length:501 start_codon:yes stop_codon:yes gene_type:complete
MKKLFLIALVATLATGCNAQNKNSDLAQSDNKANTEKPKGSWKVNKELDENGNIIKYDSIYSWSSSNQQGLTEKERDSIMKSFSSAFWGHFSLSEEGFPSFSGGNMPSLDDFFKDDFFKNGGINQSFNMDDLQKRMEALQKQFFDQYKPKPLIPAEPEKEPKKTKI